METGVRTITPEENCQDNCPRTIFLWMIALRIGELSPRKIALGQLFPRNIISSHTNGPEENCPTRKLSQGEIKPDIFFPKELEVVALYSIVASSGSPSLWFNLVLDFDFCIRKTL